VTHTVLEPPPGWDDSPLPPVGARRDALYVNLSDTLVRKSDLLIALWNGEFTALPGGTTDTVIKYLAAHAGSGSTTRMSFIEEDGSAPWERQIVYWVNVPRAGDRPDDLRAAPCFLSGVGEGVLRRHPQMPKQLRRQLADLDHYNQEFASLQAQPYASSPYTLMREVPATISPEERAHLRRIDIEYGKADALAVFCQFHSHRLFRWFSYMASAMGLLFLIYAKLVPSKVFLLGYLAVLLLGLGVFHVMKSRHWFTKHLAYRVLAETMRTKFFLRLTAADRQVSAPQLIKLAGIDQFSGFGWLTNVLKSVEPLTNGHAFSPTQEDGNLALVRRIWIEAQQAYFRSKVARLERTHRRLERLKTSLVYILALITIVLVAFSEPLGSYFLDVGFNGKDLLLFLMGLLPVWLGIWELYQGKMATRELLWQYRNQLDHFSRASIELTQADDRERRVSILADLGRDSLMESYLWTIHRYHREHEPPAAG
jgi:cadmium resistance protein CadD (predicted permease)